MTVKKCMKSKIILQKFFLIENICKISKFWDQFCHMINAVTELLKIIWFWDWFCIKKNSFEKSVTVLNFCNWFISREDACNMLSYMSGEFYNKVLWFERHFDVWKMYLQSSFKMLNSSMNFVLQHILAESMMDYNIDLLSDHRNT